MKYFLFPLFVLLISCGNDDVSVRSNMTYWHLDKALKERGPSVVVKVVGSYATLRDTSGQYYTYQLVGEGDIGDDLKPGDSLY